MVLSSDKRLHYRKVELVLRYHVPNKFKYPEGYTHHLLLIFYPLRDECGLKVGKPSSYSSNLNDLGVLGIVNNTKSLVEPYGDLVNAAFLNYRADITPSWDPFSQQENKDVENELCKTELNDETEISNEIKLMRITQKQYLLNSIQPFLVTVILIVKLDL